MGRARGYASHATTSADQSRFDAVLGTRRGSMSAQAARAARKIQAREDGIEKGIAKMIAEINSPSGEGTAIDLLVTAYRGGGARAGTPEHKKLCMDLKLSQAVTGELAEADEAMELAYAIKFRHLATVAVYGDPEHCPGLTAPAASALEDLLRPDDADIQAGVVRKPFPHRARITAHTILDIGDRSEPKQYERLAPVLEGLAALLPQLPPHEHGRLSAWPFIARPMAELLRDAPTEALAGPLQPLVQAFGQRIQDGKLLPEERTVLEQSIAKQALSGQPVEALRPITDVL